VVLKIQAADSQGQLRGVRQVDGSLQAQTDPPAFAKEGVVSAASLQSFAPIAPGGIISIFGDRLADNVAQSGDAPLPQQLGNTTVIIGGHIAPLFYVSQTQVNALVPLDSSPIPRTRFWCSAERPIRSRFRWTWDPRNPPRSNPQARPLRWRIAVPGPSRYRPRIPQPLGMSW
jgi:hypothetical protein